MANDKLLDDIDIFVDAFQSFKKWLDKVYYDQEFSTVFNRVILSIMNQCATFLIDNLVDQGSIYREKKGL